MHDHRPRRRPRHAPRASFADTLAVYLRPRVLIVLFLGFSAGLPLALSGSTLQVWVTESGVDLKTIGLFAVVGTPYTIKFLWAPLVDALDVPLLSRVARPAARLAGVLAAPADRRDRAARALRSGVAPLAGRARRRCWSRPRPRPRTSSSTRSASKACPKASRPPAWRPTSPPIASACWPRPPARCSWSAGSKSWGWGKHGAWTRRLHRDGGARRHRHRHDADRDRAGEIGRGGGRACAARRQPTQADCGELRSPRSPNFCRAMTAFAGARFRRAVQVHRCACRRHDRALRHRPRLHAQRIRHDHQGRRSRRDA